MSEHWIPSDSRGCLKPWIKALSIKHENTAEAYFQSTLWPLVCLHANWHLKCVFLMLGGGGSGGGGKGTCMHNALRLLKGLSVCECILQRQHWHHWLRLISIKKCSCGAYDGREQGNKQGRKSEERESDGGIERRCNTEGQKEKQKKKNQTQTHWFLSKRPQYI